MTLSALREAVGRRFKKCAAACEDAAACTRMIYFKSSIVQQLRGLMVSLVIFVSGP
jgi:hypothetical protein